MLQEISRYDDEPESVAYHAASEVFWSDQALGRPIPRPTEMIRAIPRETIMAYMADNYRASRMVLSVSGNIDEAAVLAEARRQFGGVADVLRSLPGEGTCSAAASSGSSGAPSRSTS